MFSQYNPGALIINNKKFSEPATAALVDAMLIELHRLPEPKVILMEEANVKDEEVVICMQREMLYIDFINPQDGNNQKRYAGTKHLNTCVLAYVYSDSDNLLVHIDNTQPDLKEPLQKFKNKNDLKVILIGANPKDLLSKGNVINTLINLLNVCTNLNISMTIASQKLFERNLLLDEDKYGYVYSTLMDKANLIVRKYFKTPFAKNRFPVAEKINELKHGKVGKLLCNEKLASRIILAQWIYSENKDGQTFKAEIDNWIKTFAPNVETFYQHFDTLFSPRGFQILNYMHNIVQFYASVRLTYCAFDLVTKVVSILPRLIYTPNEAARILNHESEGSSNPYFYSVSNIGRDFVPKMSPMFYAKCRKMLNLITNDTISEEDFIQEFGIGKHRKDLIPTLYEFILQVAKKSPVSFTFFPPRTVQDMNYREDKEPHDSTALNKLNLLTNQKFILKFRSESRVVDALLTCTTHAELVNIQQQLTNFQVENTVLRDNTICVPGMNLSYTRDQITAAQK